MTLLLWATSAVSAVESKPAGTVGLSSRPADAVSEPLSWAKCADLDTGNTDIQCADLSVPVDWYRPQGGRISIALAKLPAQDPQQRIGTLLFNMGGPGSTIHALPKIAGRLSELTQWFDIVAFDPRGLGFSSGITCPQAGPGYGPLMLSPDRETWLQFAQANREWAAECRNAAGALAENLSAWQVAHDMEAIRKAVGEGGLNYFGNSYGTVYGQAYADLFPTKVHRMLLDSAVDHTERLPLQMTAPMAKVVREQFRQFGLWCETEADCALYPNNAREVWDKLMAEARRHPLPAPGVGNGKTVGPNRLRVQTWISMPNPSGWPAFAEALAKARAGDASDLYVDPPNTTGTSARRLAVCSDFSFRGGWDAMTWLDRQLGDIAPRIGSLMGRYFYGPCVGLEHQLSYPPQPIDADGLPPILIVNGLQDPGATAAGGRAVADQLPGSVWIGADTWHAPYLLGNRCIRDIVNRYLRTGDLPRPGRICPASEPSAEQRSTHRRQSDGH